MNSVTTPNLSQPAILSGTEVEERPKVHPGDHADQPLPPVTEDPRYIGTSSERPSARKLVQGQGTYIDDIELPRMVHVVYWRSPLAHAKITRIDMDAARKAPGVVLVAAILAADVVGYSRLVGADEEATVGRLRAVRREVLEPRITAHKGRLFKTNGDGFLAEFGMVEPEPM